MSAAKVWRTVCITGGVVVMAGLALGGGYRSTYETDARSANQRVTKWLVVKYSEQMIVSRFSKRLVYLGLPQPEARWCVTCKSSFLKRRTYNNPDCESMAADCVSLVAMLDAHRIDLPEQRRVLNDAIGISESDEYHEFVLDVERRLKWPRGLPSDSENVYENPPPCRKETRNPGNPGREPGEPGTVTYYDGPQIGGCPGFPGFPGGFPGFPGQSPIMVSRDSHLLGFPGQSPIMTVPK